VDVDHGCGERGSEGITGARKQEIGLEGARLKVKLVAKPVKGKANEELIDYIARVFNVRRREVVILSGEKDTRKVLSIPVPQGDFERLLGEMGG
jgi:uncharacterized protein (TIGR00251 family)